MCFNITKQYIAEKTSFFIVIKLLIFGLKNSTDFKHSALQILYQTINASKKFPLKISFTSQPNVSREFPAQKKKINSFLN